MPSQCTPLTAMSSALSPPSPRPCRILVVDDDEDIRAIVCDLLDGEDYPVTTATNGAEALQLVQSAQPCVVLLDMRMPVLDGWGFLQALRAQGAAPAVLVMTMAPDARRWAREVQADGYVAKPFNLQALLNEVARLCAARGAEGAQP